LGRREEQQHRLLTERECAIAIRCATASVASKTLNLLEESRVLDGDNGLVGENLEQLDLSVRERTHLRSTEIAPMASPARIRGTATMVLCPILRASSLPSGYSFVSTCTSAT